MKQVVMQSGKVSVIQVPVPALEPGTILVEVAYSSISAGTEIAGVRSGGEPLWKRALKHPDEVSNALAMMREQGVRRIHRMIRAKLSTATALGYSAAGTVIAVGEGIIDFKIGDRVACAGAQCAHHAEVICVPRNLAVKLPNELDLSHASTVTLGSIATQGIRRLNPTLGENIVVLGLGILGQLTAQLLKANGCHAIGIDIDSKRVALAKEAGIKWAFHPGNVEIESHVHRITDGFGVDGVIITASSASDALISQAFNMCRKKGRVVLVGDVGLNINREDIFKKELDFLISSSYGPGRYDSTYEEGGIDYPLPYVRWTENRNMAEYLACIADGRINLELLISHIVDIDDAEIGYERLKLSADDLIIVLRYSNSNSNSSEPHRLTFVKNENFRNSIDGVVRFGLVGASSFAKGMHLVNLEKIPKLARLQAVMSRTGLNAKETAKQFGAAYATTDLDHLLSDREVDALLIATRHNHHAFEVVAGLNAGKHVLVEKPLAINRQDLEAISAFYQSNPNGPLLMTGFNRRFSPCIKYINSLLFERSGPMIINYRMNVGHLPVDNWVHGPEGGGRNIGEACHIYDLFTALTGSRVASVSASALTPSTRFYSGTDNFIATIKFEDGSVASLTYTALGNKAHSKECMDIFVDGKVLLLDDYRLVKVIGSRQKGINLRLSDKGHKQELVKFVEAISNNLVWPIPLWEQLQATDIALQVDEQIGSGF